MNSLSALLSKIWSLGLEAYAFDQLQATRRVRRWALNSDKFNRLYAERRSGVKVIDLGCGSPAHRAPVRDTVGVEHYWGIDLDIQNKPDLVSDVARLPFPSNSLDLVRAFSLFEHTYNYREILTDIYRSLRPGGCLFIQTPFLLEFHGYPSDYFRYTHIAWRRILEDTGFGVIDDEQWGKGFFINLAKMLENGSFSFIGARWYGLRFTLRALSRIAWRMQRYDKHYRGSLYASVLILGEKPGAEEAPPEPAP
ncbi:MAG TPA: class I SAM-dependent methyltransferase [Anaerolineae bacterium]|nr:class I SAM-dependent methyltransferase [Anaerolineae bacterium]